MNQILSTNNNSNKNNKLSTHKIIQIFSIAVIIISIFILALSGYRLYKSIQKRKNLARPTIETTRISNEQISIKINCEDGLNSLVYIWNETNDNAIPLNGTKNFERIIDIPYNKNNTLKIEVETINKVKTEIVQEFEVEVDDKKPNIESISASGAILNINASDDSGIDYLEYFWEGEGTKRIEADVADNKTINVKIDIQRGTHTLNLVVADIYGNKEEISRSVTGVNEPEIEVIQYNNVVNVKVTHDMGIKQIKVLINNKLYLYDETSPEYSEDKQIVELEYPLDEGDNIIKIIAYSLEELSEVEEENVNNYSRKAYAGRCTYEVSE